MGFLGLSAGDRRARRRKLLDPTPTVRTTLSKDRELQFTSHRQFLLWEEVNDESRESDLLNRSHLWVFPGFTQDEILGIFSELQLKMTRAPFTMGALHKIIVKNLAHVRANYSFNRQESGSHVEFMSYPEGATDGACSHDRREHPVTFLYASSPDSLRVHTGLIEPLDHRRFRLRNEDGVFDFLRDKVISHSWNIAHDSPVFAISARAELKGDSIMLLLEFDRRFSRERSI